MSKERGTYMLHVKNVNTLLLAQTADDHHITKYEQVALGELA